MRLLNKWRRLKNVYAIWDGNLSILTWKAVPVPVPGEGKEYNRLYEELSENKFDIIVIKSQDRLMRNTRDWYLFVDRMVKAGKQLYMYMEQKFYSADDALITGIKAILAEEYSRELSRKINNAHYHRQKNGGAVILTSNTYGYRRMPDKSIRVIEEEARSSEECMNCVLPDTEAERFPRCLLMKGSEQKGKSIF